MANVQRTPTKKSKTKANNLTQIQTQSEPEINIAGVNQDCVKTNRSKRSRHESSPQCESDLTPQFLRDKLASWKKTQDSCISKMLEEQTTLISKLVCEIGEIKAQNSQIQTSNAQIWKSNEEIMQSMSFMNNTFEDMKKEIENLRRDRHEQQLHIVNLEKKINDLQLKSRSSSLEIRNIPQDNTETTTSLVNSVSNIGESVGVPITNLEIRDIYRLPGKSPSTTSPRPIIVEFTTVQRKQAVLSAVRQYNKGRGKDDKINTSLIGIPGQIVEPDPPTESSTIEPIEASTIEPEEEIATEVPTVRIVQGTVVGTVAEDGNYFEFHGIPYADSTSGSHRFQAPSPPPSFQDTFTANRKNIKCVRALGNGFEGTEDCLVANIFTPTINSTRNLPVMVWIKGKEFDAVNEHVLSFRNFMEKEVVVVALNYRESILGFLCLGTQTAPGNAGLKDIVAGLQWIQQNIEQFGGNPNDVTLFGHGSGAAAVDLVTLSPTSESLVHKAIAQSGSAFAPWAVTRDNIAYAVQVAEALGHVVTNTQELSEVFIRTSVSALMAVINELDLTDNSLAFAPCIEREDLEGIVPFLAKTPYQMISEGEFVQIPFIMGFVDNEGTIRAEEAIEHEWLERMENSFSDFLQPDLEFESKSERAEVAEEIKAFYFRGDTISMDNVNDYITYHGDTMMLVSTIREARMRAEVSTAPLYLYQFSYKGALGAPFVGPITVNTAAHSEELAYLFYDTPSAQIPLIDLTVGDILVERWTNFARTGIPVSEISQVPWRPFTIETYSYLRVLDDEELNDGLTATLELELENPHPETIMFWDDIYEEHFLDAKATWSITDRNEEEEEDVAEEDGSGQPEEDDEVVDETEFETEAPEGEPDSASTAVAYTFSILTLFAIINNFHSNIILC